MIGANTTISIYRMIYGSSTNTYPGSADYTGIEAFIESMRGEVTQVLNQGFNVEDYLCYCDPVTIDVGDKVIDSQGSEYRVSGVERHENNQDVPDLYTITLRKERNSSH